MLNNQFYFGTQWPIKYSSINNVYVSTCAFQFVAFTRYDIKIFRTRLDETKTCKPGVNYTQRRRILEKTDTWRSSVCHDDRHFGAFYALMHNVGRDDIRGLGHWEDDVMDTHYAKLFSPDTVAKMAGFADAKHYYLERAQLDPFHLGDEGISKMASSVLPKLEDENFLKAIEQVNYFCIVFKTKDALWFLF